MVGRSSTDRGTPFITAVVVAASIVGCAAVYGIEETTTVEPPEAGAAPAPEAGTDASTLDVDAEPSPPPAPPARCDVANLVGRWTFDEGAGPLALDCTSNRIDGRLSNVNWGAGQTGKAATFDGGWITFTAPNPALLRLDGAFTIAAWVRLARATGATQYVVGKTAGGAQPTKGFRLAVDKDLKLSLSLGDGTAVFETTGGPALAIGKWVHVAATYSPGTAVTLYLDRKAIVTDKAAIPATIAIAPDDLQAGARGDGEYHLAGALDDLRLYDRALSAAEVAESP